MVVYQLEILGFQQYNIFCTVQFHFRLAKKQNVRHRTPKGIKINTRYWQAAVSLAFVKFEVKIYNSVILDNTKSL